MRLGCQYPGFPASAKVSCRGLRTTVGAEATTASRTTHIGHFRGCACCQTVSQDGRTSARYSLAERVELRGGQINLQCGQVFLQVLQRERPRDRQHDRGTAEEPRERDLCGRCAVSRGDLCDGATAVTAQRKEGNEDDVLPRPVVDNRLVSALGEVVVVLDGGDRHDSAGSFDLVDRDLRDANVQDLAAVLALLDGGETLFDRCLRVDSMQVVE